MTTVIGFIGQKGGVGKSTLTRALAVAAARSGLSVKIADLDLSQSTVADWNKLRLSKNIEPTLSVEVLRDAAAAVRAAKGYDLLIIDAPGRADAATVTTAKVSDLLVQPTRATRDDLLPGVKMFRRLLAEGIAANKLVFILNQIASEAEAEAAREYLTEADFKVLPGFLPHRPIYGQVQNDGLSLVETRFEGLKARAEALMQAIVDNVP